MTLSHLCFFIKMCLCVCFSSLHLCASVIQFYARILSKVTNVTALCGFILICFCNFSSALLSSLWQKSRQDVSNFDKEFTKMVVELTPTDKLFIMNLDQNEFQGFSYTNPEFIIQVWVVSAAWTRLLQPRAASDASYISSHDHHDSKDTTAHRNLQHPTESESSRHKHTSSSIGYSRTELGPCDNQFPERFMPVLLVCTGPQVTASGGNQEPWWTCSCVYVLYWLTIVCMFTWFPSLSPVKVASWTFHDQYVMYVHTHTQTHVCAGCSSEGWFITSCLS